ncbi:carbohydrate-binding module family 50 protein [Xylaria arbuscula]|nr:carbohydrate-binding module family 50 protein [Xylaria arbuscula]
MSSRWSEFDTDAERLPEGMKRIGYDADSQKYTFRDADGSLWESASGNRYGQLRRVATTASATSTTTTRTSTSYSEGDYDYDDDDGSKPTQPLTHFDQLGLYEPSQNRESLGHREPDHSASWRQEMRPLLNWFLLVGLFLLAIFWFISGGSSKGGGEVARSCPDDATPYVIKADDTCWAIAEARSVNLDDLLQKNKGLDCDKLSIGETICVPAA